MFWRCDLWDHTAPTGERRARHSKVLATFAFFLGCFGMMLVAWWIFFVDDAPLDPNQIAILLQAAAAGGLVSGEVVPLLAAAGLRPEHGAELGFLLAFAFLVFAMPFGLAGYKAAAASRVGAAAATAVGVSSAAHSEARAEIGSAAIAKRRTQGGDFEISE